MSIAVAPIRITNVETAIAYLNSVGDHMLEHYQVGDNLVIPFPCGRCGGKGYGHWFQDGGICYECNGANTSHHKKVLPIVCHAKAVKSKITGEARKNAKYLASKEANEAAKIAGQKKWCEANGHGAITFDELKIKRDAEKAATQDKLIYVGTIGKREVFKLKLEKMFSFDGHFGLKVLHKFSDANGNQLIWWTGDWFGEAGQEFEVKATVKAHEEYNGAKQTVLSRVKDMNPVPVVV